ncbi:MAG: DinB family protein [Desulfobacteraceae bacterium]|nr:DinB family protein [Desulfobacteraceae bacterium]MBU4002247.1 DinB family protein [Pseudomonadota bacterium]MBU4054769.1 DinB family protein [Pseudomonadota bacterium]
MKWQQLVMEEFLRIERELGQVLNDLTVDDLNHQPAPDCNSIGWLAWHLTRSHDRNMSELMGEEQLWIADQWHAKFNRAPDAGETGVGHTTEQAKAFKSTASKVLMDYHHAILKRIEQYIHHRLTEKELDRETHSPTLKNVANVATRIAGVIQQGFLHVGQAGYVRGLLKGKGWYP